MEDILGVINKPQFDTDFLSPGKVVKIYVKYDNGTNFRYGYNERAVICKSSPFEIEIVDKTTEARVITLKKVLDGSILIEEVI